MPELIEQMYCSQQIVIPPKFPYVLKRYAKAAIKTQPYDLLRWSFEYFQALAEHRTPPVKLRLEYPVFSTEGGLTRGYLKVLACQLEGMVLVPIQMVKSIWLGSCLDPQELVRVLCLCEVHRRAEFVSRLDFIAVAGGLLTKSLTQTMILLCETLTKEPEGGSAAIPLENFMTMYRFLAKMDASKDVKYLDGYREGTITEPSLAYEESSGSSLLADESVSEMSDEYWQDSQLLRVSLINDNVARSARLSMRLSQPPIGKISRSPSVERAGLIERENMRRERKDRPEPDELIDAKLREMSGAQIADDAASKLTSAPEYEPNEIHDDEIQIVVTDEDGVEIPAEYYGENDQEDLTVTDDEDFITPETDANLLEKQRVANIVLEVAERLEMRRADLETTFQEIAEIVEKYNSANYDLGVVAGRQMSTTSGEYIVNTLNKEMWAYIDEQIAVLPDPELKRKKATPEELEMVRQLVEEWLDDNMETIVPEIEEEEEEEIPIPEVVTVYAVPGIGPVVDDDIIREFTEYAFEVAKTQADLFMPRNVRHFLCPPLEKFVDQGYEVPHKEEEIPTGGVITD